jgi:hypothetical protein
MNANGSSEVLIGRACSRRQAATDGREATSKKVDARTGAALLLQREGQGKTRAGADGNIQSAPYLLGLSDQTAPRARLPRCEERLGGGRRMETGG